MIFVFIGRAVAYFRPIFYILTHVIPVHNTAGMLCGSPLASSAACDLGTLTLRFTRALFSSLCYKLCAERGAELPELIFG